MFVCRLCTAMHLHTLVFHFCLRSPVLFPPWLTFGSNLRLNHYPFLLFIHRQYGRKRKYSSVGFDNFSFLCLQLCFKGNLLLRARIQSGIVWDCHFFIGQDSLGGNHPLFGEMSSEMSCGWRPRLWDYRSEVHRVKGALHIPGDLPFSHWPCSGNLCSPTRLCSVVHCQIVALPTLNWLCQLSLPASIESSVVYFVCLIVEDINTASGWKGNDRV